MAKYSGVIGLAKTIEQDPVNNPGVYIERIVEFPCVADVIQNSWRRQSGDAVIDGINLSSKYSILADTYLRENFYCIRYLKIHGAKWSIDSVDVQYPRLILSLGGLYNG